MPKDRIDCKAVKEGKKGVMLQIKAAAEDFGHMKCTLDYHLETPEMTDAIYQAALDAEKLLDGMEVDPTDDESVGNYVEACGKALANVMLKIKEVLS